MSVLLAEATVRVTADVSKVGAQAEEGVRRQSSHFGAVGSIMGGILGATLVTSGVESIKRLFASGIDEAKESTQLSAQFEAGITSTGNAANLTAAGMEELAGKVAGYSGQSKTSIGQTEAVLQTFVNLRNVGPDKIFDDATVAAANMAAKMGGSASENAVRLGRALNDPEKGVTALTRVGVQFDQQQKDQIKTLQESGDTLDAQKIILGELSKEFGGAAQAAGSTWPGAINRFKVASSTIAGTIVNAFGPTVLKIFNKLDDVLVKLEPAATKLGDAISKKLGGIDFGKLLSTVLPLASALSPLQLVFKALEPSIPVVTKVVGELAGVLGGIFKAILPIIATLLGQVAKVIAQLLPAIVPLVKIIGDGLVTILKALAPVLPPLIDGIGQIFTALEPLIPAFIQLVIAIEPILPPLVKLIVEILPPLIQGFTWLVQNVLVPLVSFIVSILVPTLGLMGTKTSDVFGGIAKGIGAVFSGVVSIVKGAINSVISLVNGAIGAIDKLQLKLPAILGGATIGFNIPKLPMLARGSNDSPGTFIAGENGPELVTDRPHSTVYDAQKTAGMLGGGGGGGGNVYHFAAGAVTVNASDVKELAELLDMLDSLPQVARSGPGTGKAA